MTDKRRKKSTKQEEEFYVAPAELKKMLSEYYEQEDSETIPDELAEAVHKIAQGLSYNRNFINYSYREDMVGDALVKMIQAVRAKKFKLESGTNPFSYFTTVAFHEFINRIKKEKRNQEEIQNYKEINYTDLMKEQN